MKGNHAVRIESDPILYLKSLIPMPELLVWLRDVMKRDYSRYTIYKWVREEGMPHRKIRGGLYFSPNQVAEWLRRK